VQVALVVGEHRLRTAADRLAVVRVALPEIGDVAARRIVDEFGRLAAGRVGALD
jgi:hypothetical protein